MSTDDIVTMTSSCLCGAGKIIVTQTSPDHPYVRAGQISYSGEIVCPVCSDKYCIENGYSGSMPRMVERPQQLLRSEAEAALRKAEAQFASSPEAQTAIQALVSSIDSQPTKKAKHRLLVAFGLHPSSYSTYIKSDTSGLSAVRYISGSSIAHAAKLLSPPLNNTEFFIDADNIFRALREKFYAIQVLTIKTGATWMAA